MQLSRLCTTLPGLLVHKPEAEQYEGRLQICEHHHMFSVTPASRRVRGAPLSTSQWCTRTFRFRCSCTQGPNQQGRSEYLYSAPMGHVSDRARCALHLLPTRELHEPCQESHARGRPLAFSVGILSIAITCALLLAYYRSRCPRWVQGHNH